MSYIAITQVHLDEHAKHDEAHEHCALCRRFGPAPAPDGASVGKVIAVNAPQSIDPKTW